MVNPKDIIYNIRKLNTSKSHGYDKIPSSLVKDGIVEISKPLSFLVNLCLEQSTFPTLEK